MLRGLIKRMAHWVQHLLRGLVGPLCYEKLLFILRHRYWPHLQPPRTHNERLAHRKFFGTPANAVQLADKFAVRELVAVRIGAQHLNEVYWAGDDVNTIDWAALPASFVAKGTHGAGREFLIFVADKAAMDPTNFRRRAQAVLDRHYGVLSNEPWYAGIPPRLMIEKYLTDTRYDVVPDYKCYVFNGRVAYIQHDMGRYADHTNCLYDREWKVAPFRISRVKPGIPVPAPKALQDIIAAAEKLGAGFPFIRVDLYAPNDGPVVFGELTITPAAARSRVTPDVSHDFSLGGLWRA